MKLKMIIVGKDRNDPIVAAANEYGARIARVYPFELTELKEEPAKSSTPIDRVRRIEAERIERALDEDDYVIALDERGKEQTSVQLAERLGKWANEGRAGVAFVIGGPNGLDPDFVQKSKERWALSKMTLPHRVARLILAEQLYRACTILRHEPYHK